MPIPVLSDQEDRSHDSPRVEQLPDADDELEDRRFQRRAWLAVLGFALVAALAFAASAYTWPWTPTYGFF